MLPGTLNVMTDLPDYFTPGLALPDPTTATGPTRWVAPDPGGQSGWAEADPPAAMPPAVEPVTLRTGWLLAGRTGDDAA